MGSNTLICSSCSKEKSKSEFAKRTRKCLDCKRAYERDWYKRLGIEYRRDRQLRHKFGITLDQYKATLAAQGGVCAICRKPESVAGGKSLSVDHDHSTGKVRGLLCNYCNVGIGHFLDDINLLASAQDYLDRWRNH